MVPSERRTPRRSRDRIVVRGGRAGAFLTFLTGSRSRVDRPIRFASMPLTGQAPVDHYDMGRGSAFATRTA